MTNELSSKTLEKIKKEKIEPTARWQFLMKEYVVWVLFALSVIVGGLAMAVIFFLMKVGALPFLKEQNSFLDFISFIPYFWFVLLAIFVFIAYLNFKYTQKGYKYNTYLIIIISMIISVLFGGVIYAVKGGEVIESLAYKNFHPYRKIMDMKGDRWSRRFQDRLSGIVKEKYENGEFDLETFEKQMWLIKMMSEKTHCPFEIGSRLRMTGKVLEPGVFEAEAIMPWFGRPGERPERCPMMK